VKLYPSRDHIDFKLRSYNAEYDLEADPDSRSFNADTAHLEAV